MKVQVKYLTFYRELTGRYTEEVNLPDSTDVNGLIDFLAKRYGEPFLKKLFDENGELREYAIILVNGRDIRHLNGLKTKLNNGDKVAFLPPASGG